MTCKRDSSARMVVGIFRDCAVTCETGSSLSWNPCQATTKHFKEKLIADLLAYSAQLIALALADA
jgi:hypothetical protein